MPLSNCAPHHLDGCSSILYMSDHHPSMREEKLHFQSITNYKTLQEQPSAGRQGTHEQEP